MRERLYHLSAEQDERASPHGKPNWRSERIAQELGGEGPSVFCDICVVLEGGVEE
jgi:hypothetical protein